MRRGLLLWQMDVTPASSARMIFLIILTWAQSNIGDSLLVLTFYSFHAWGANVRYTPATRAEGSVAMVASNAFANNFTVDVSECEAR